MPRSAHRVATPLTRGLSTSAARTLADKLGLSGGVWNWITGLDLNTIGFGVVGLFVIVWAVAVTVWKLGRIEQKRTIGLRAAEEPAVD